MTESRRRTPRSSRVILASAIAVMIGGALAIFIIFGGFSGSSTVIPPCESLPSADQARDALESKPELVRAIKAAGTDVRVGVSTPCPGDSDLALIQVTYASDDQKEIIDELLGQREGFGVPLDVAKR
ncbi:MAG: hypothetical protein RI885_1213 [Actinomycetota bacterium]